MQKGGGFCCAALTFTPPVLISPDGEGTGKRRSLIKTIYAEGKRKTPPEGGVFTMWRLGGVTVANKAGDLGR